MREIFYYSLLTAARDRVIYALFAAMLALVLMCYVLGNATLVEQTQASLAMAGAALRLLGVLGVVLFVTGHIRQMESSRELLVFLSRPITRFGFLAGQMMAVFLLASVMALVFAAVLVLLFQLPWVHAVCWAVSLVAEMALMASFALAAALVLKGQVAAMLASIGFYLLSRMMIYFTLTEASQLGHAHAVVDVMAAFVLRGLSHILPRLDRFTQSEWLVYGAPSLQELLLLSGQSFVYVMLLMLVAWLDFSKREM